jgi:hypothetical protein
VSQAVDDNTIAIKNRVAAIEGSMTEISESIQAQTLNNRDNEVLAWIKSCDPSTNHESA